ncbi:hypothetical protein ACFQY7_21135 [Actinomadura luteofluorescens]|uniref:hypothetical protein n=1 Tax=Actinomadura luteofluorescens TaxID=46163 RepID=UPI0036305E2C
MAFDEDYRREVLEPARAAGDQPPRTCASGTRSTDRPPAPTHRHSTDELRSTDWTRRPSRRGSGWSGSAGGGRAGS